MIEVRYNKWLKQQYNSKYPFETSATLTSTSGDVTIPLPAFLDCSIRSTSKNVYLAEIEASELQYIIKFKAGTKLIAQSEALDSFGSEDIRSIMLFDEFGDRCGTLLCDNIALGSVLTKASPKIEFSYNATKLSARTISFVDLDKVNSIGTSEKKLSGDVAIVAEDGIRGDITSGQLQFHAIGEPMVDKLLQGDSWQKPQYITKVNGRPVRNGNLFITVGRLWTNDPPLRLRRGESGITIDWLK